MLGDGRKWNRYLKLIGAGIERERNFLGKWKPLFTLYFSLYLFVSVFIWLVLFVVVVLYSRCSGFFSATNLHF